VFSPRLDPHPAQLCRVNGRQIDSQVRQLAQQAWIRRVNLLRPAVTWLDQLVEELEIFPRKPPQGGGKKKKPPPPFFRNFWGGGRKGKTFFSRGGPPPLCGAL